jgi:soluble lytic murein transglycosylase-like protein
MVNKGVRFFYILAIGIVIIAAQNLVSITKETVEYNLETHKGTITSPYSLQVYNSIEKYSNKYKIPKYIAYNIAFLETRYQGPFDWDYHGKLTSYAGAKGPMQIMPATANYIIGKNITKNELLNNIDLNIKISMKLLNKLHKQYDDWDVVCGYYNTGYPQVNSYARYCASNKNYKSRWVSY